MAINAKSEGRASAPILEAGTYHAICVQMVHIGTIKDEYNEGKFKDKIRIAWELPTEKHVYKEEKGEESRMISKEYTLSLHEKATLRKDLEAWRGKPFTAEQLEGFDVTAIIGAGCMLSVVHKTPVKVGGNVYAKISSVAKLMKNTKAIKPTIDEVLFMYDQPVDELVEVFKALPTFIQDKIVTSAEWIALKVERPTDEEEPDTTPKDEVAEAIAEDAPPF